MPEGLLVDNGIYYTFDKQVALNYYLKEFVYSRELPTGGWSSQFIYLYGEYDWIRLMNYWREHGRPEHDYHN